MDFVSTDSKRRVLLERCLKLSEAGSGHGLRKTKEHILSLIDTVHCDAPLIFRTELCGRSDE